MDLLNIDVPSPERNKYYENIKLSSGFIEMPETVSDDKYLEVLSILVHQQRYPIDYKKLKAMIYRKATVYNEVNMEIGKRQRA